MQKTWEAEFKSLLGKWELCAAAVRSDPTLLGCAFHVTMEKINPVTTEAIARLGQWDGSGEKGPLLPSLLCTCNTGTETLEPNSQPYWKWRVPVQRETWLKNISWKELEDTQSQSLAPHTHGQVRELFHIHTLIQQRGRSSIFIDNLLRNDLGGLERWPSRTKHLLLFQRTWVLSSVPSTCIRWIPSFNSSLRKSNVLFWSPCALHSQTQAHAET